MCSGSSDFQPIPSGSHTFHSGILTEDGVRLNYRLDSSLFNICRLQAKSKISSEYVFELQYADDADLPSHTADGLQRILKYICEAYRRTGLVVNVKKTKSSHRLLSNILLPCHHLPLTMHRLVLFSSLPTLAVSYQLTVILRMRPDLSSCILQSQPDHLNQSRRL